MNNPPNTKEWKVGDYVIHDYDRKSAEYLLKILKVDGSNYLVAYVDTTHNATTQMWSEQKYLLDPAEFDIPTPDQMIPLLQVFKDVIKINHKYHQVYNQNLHDDLLHIVSEIFEYLEAETEFNLQGHKNHKQHMDDEAADVAIMAMGMFLNYVEGSNMRDDGEGSLNPLPDDKVALMAYEKFMRKFNYGLNREWKKEHVENKQ